MLHGYLSAHGGGVRDRRVEPFAFTTNYVQVLSLIHISSESELRNPNENRRTHEAPGEAKRPTIIICNGDAGNMSYFQLYLAKNLSLIHIYANFARDNSTPDFIVKPSAISASWR